MKLRLQRDGRTFDTVGLQLLGSGGEAHVYVLPGTPWAAKVYHGPVAGRDAKLQLMLDNPPRDPTAARGHVSIAWPQDLLIDPHGRIVGYVMPLVDRMRRMIDFYNPKTRRKECPLFTYKYLATTALNLAIAVRALHQRGYVMGDVNESNILVAETTMVTLVDTDSFQVREPGNGRIHRCTVGSPLFTPREMQGMDFTLAVRRAEHDLFGLGVLLFHLLMEGSHPFQVRFTGAGDSPEPVEVIRHGHFPHDTGSAMWQPPPLAPPFGMLDARLRGLFTRCFVNGHRYPNARPTADEWCSNLAGALGILVQCKANPSHLFWPHVKGCPWCERTVRLSGRDPFPPPILGRPGVRPAPAKTDQKGAAVPWWKQLFRWVNPVAVPVLPSTPVAQSSTPSPFSPAIAPAQRHPATPPARNPPAAPIRPATTPAAWPPATPGRPPTSPARNPPTGPIRPVTNPAQKLPAVANPPSALPKHSPGAAPVSTAATTRVDPLAGASAKDLAEAKVGDLRGADLGQTTKLLLCGIPAGTFTTGGSKSDETPHNVTLTKSFWLGRTQVTQKQWLELMGRNPSKFKGDDLPVENVNWDDSMEFCAKLNGKINLPSGWQWALPTEAEWEYACRAGTTGACAGRLDEMAWYSKNSGQGTHRVAAQKPNAWGLYDMHGNVWEWCADWYANYSTDAATDPIGPSSGLIRVNRGGSWINGAATCRSALRNGNPPNARNFGLGFRVAIVQVGS